MREALLSTPLVQAATSNDPQFTTNDYAIAGLPQKRLSPLVFAFDVRANWLAVRRASSIDVTPSSRQTSEVRTGTPAFAIKALAWNWF
jgi:hypothetical protein